MAAQDQAILTNYIKVNIFHQLGSALCRLCGCYVESIDHILSSCSVIADTQVTEECPAQFLPRFVTKHS